MGINGDSRFFDWRESVIGAEGLNRVIASPNDYNPVAWNFRTDFQAPKYLLQFKELQSRKGAIT